MKDEVEIMACFLLKNSIRETSLDLHKVLQGVPGDFQKERANECIQQIRPSRVRKRNCSATRRRRIVICMMEGVHRLYLQ